MQITLNPKTIQNINVAFMRTPFPWEKTMSRGKDGLVITYLDATGAPILTLDASLVSGLVMSLIDDLQAAMMEKIAASNELKSQEDKPAPVAKEGKEVPLYSPSKKE